MPFLPNELVEQINQSYSLSPIQRLELFARLAERVSLIPVRGGFPNENEPPSKFKAPIEKNWTQWCKTRRNFQNKDFSSERAGIACGPASGILVFDIDDLENLNAWLAANTIQPDFNTFTVSTSGVNRGHLYYKYPIDGKEYKNVANKNGGFDVRGLGGQVICPGSFHPVTRKIYTILKNTDLAEPPQWLLDYILDDKSTHKEIIEITDQFINALPISDKHKLNIFTHTPVGSRSEVSIGVMAALISNGIDEDTIRQIYDKYPIGEKTNEKGDDWFLRELIKARQFMQDKKSSKANQHNSYTITVYSALDIVKSNINFEFMIDNVWPKGEALMITGVGGVGKSMMTLQLVMDLVNPPVKGFLDTFKISTSTKHKIIFVQAENYMLGIKQRLSTICNPNSGYTISDQLLNESILFAGNENDITTVGDLENKRFRDSLSHKIEETAADIIVVDPLVSFHQKEENSNNEMRKVLDILSELCKNMNVTPLVIHHIGKKDSETGQGGGRGASAIGDWSANTWKLSKSKNIFTFTPQKTRNFETPNAISLELHYNRFRPIIKSLNDDKTSLVVQALKANNGKIVQQNNLIAAMENILKAQNRDPIAHGTHRNYIQYAVNQGYIKQTDIDKKITYELV